MTKKKRSCTLSSYNPLKLREELKIVEQLKEENARLKSVLSQPLNKQAELYLHYKQKSNILSNKLDTSNKNYTKAQIANQSLRDELIEIRETNKELKERQDAFKNTIDLLLEQLDEKDLQLENKDELISHIIEESIVQSNKDKYFDFM